MIVDCLENAALYHGLGPRFKMALDYLSRTDFSQMPDGRYELDGDNVFAIVVRYETKPADAAKWEAHRKYTDVQYMVEGRERMGYTPLNARLTASQPYDSEKDVVFYNAQGDFIDAPAGRFIIFMPHDVHAPGIAADAKAAPSRVFKVVVKCRYA
jgi:YhcH/YjgK/YiaL family protein